MTVPDRRPRPGTPAGDVLDFVAVGAGPFNLGLAALAEPAGLQGVVLESREETTWHGGMMLPEATLQVPFMADLVTMADPTSPYSFLAFLKETGRLYPFYIRESFYPLRREYDRYLRWAADRLPVRLGHHVQSVRRDGDLFAVTALTADGPTTLLARHVVLGVGTTPHVPDAARAACDADGGLAIHSAEYLQRKEQLQESGSITVVGSGQSAAEVYRDLLEDARDRDYRLTWVTRSPRFFPMEYTKLTLEMTSPEYTAYFQSLPTTTRDRLVVEHKPLYKGISGDLVDDIYDTLYRLGLDGPVPTDLLAGTTLTASRWDEGAGRFALELRHDETDQAFTVGTASLVLATGYRAQLPDLVEPLREGLHWDERGRYAVAADYTIDAEHRVFVQNAEEHTHGFVAPDLGMGAFRSSIIVNAMAGREVYAVEERIAFQTFGAPTSDRDGGARAGGARSLTGVDR
ncbi:MAG: SidA/IucD/PvdA family monooxygenase [Aeromicrobium erythreum]